MVFGLGKVKGPRALLSSAIASGLATYFDVDENLIEANLLTDKKIILNHVSLKAVNQIIQTFGDKETGRSSVAEITGQVEQVVFSWKWNLSSQEKTWVQDASLSIHGIHFQTKLSWKDNKTAAEMIKLAKPAKTSSKKGKMSMYIKEQVAMVIDSLKLTIKDYKFTLELPTMENTFQIFVGGSAIEIISMGRKTKAKTDRPSIVSDSGAVECISSQQDVLQAKSREALPLEQVFLMDSFSVMVCEINQSSSTSFPLLDTFSYKATALRVAGERFLTGMQKGLIVEGDPSHGGDLKFHAGPQQVKVLQALASMVSVSSTKNEKTSVVTSEASIEVLHLEKDESQQDMITSLFRFPLHSLTLELESSKVSLSLVVLKYQADGKIADIECRSLQIMPNQELGRNVRMEMKEISVTAHPSLRLNIGTIESCFVPGVVEVTEPIHHISISRNKDNSFDVRLPSVHATKLVKDSEITHQETSREKGTRKHGPVRSLMNTINFMKRKEGMVMATAKIESSAMKAAVPFPVSVFVQELHLMNKDILSIFHEIDLAVAPGGAISVCIQEVRNDLLVLVDVACSATIPKDKVDEIRDLHFACASTSLTAGHSSEEWEERFSNRKGKRKEKLNYKLPNAHIEALNLRIGLKGKLLSARDTEMVIKPFIGNETTTKRDLTRHYMTHILTRSPGFITNAEVFGVNAVDTSFVLAATAAGPLGGLAAVAGVDAVKGVIAAGKRSRGDIKTKGDHFRVSDVLRGVVHAAKEAADEGAALRGKREGSGNILDWAVGATTSTTNYAKENKSRLGAAGAGGAAVIAGTLIAGPVGGLAAGFMTSAVTGKALDSKESGEGSLNE